MRPRPEAALLLLRNRGGLRVTYFYDEGRDKFYRLVAGIDAEMNFAVGRLSDILTKSPGR